MGWFKIIWTIYKKKKSYYWVPYICSGYLCFLMNTIALSRAVYWQESGLLHSSILILSYTSVIHSAKDPSEFRTKVICPTYPHLIFRWHSETFPSITLLLCHMLCVRAYLLYACWRKRMSSSACGRQTEMNTSIMGKGAWKQTVKELVVACRFYKCLSCPRVLL